jgi:N-acetyl sugar amidotransferase
VKFCKKCTLPEISPLQPTLDSQGVCSGCRASLHKDRIDWSHRRKLFEELIDEYRGKAEYDCIVPVSGGKDSYFAAHLCMEFGLRPLLVTYHGNNYIAEGTHNLERMRDVFKADHIIFHPSTDVLIRMNRIGFKKAGDMNWHNHCGIYTYPVQVAVRQKIPLVLWGDHGFVEQAGMYSHDDFIEYTAKDRFEHALHGYDWHDFVEETEGLVERDLRWATYPSDEAIMSVGVRGIFLSNYFYYDGNYNAKIAMEKYGWIAAKEPYDRTYRRISNVDDMHENGVHDYMKWIKFGYGRCTDHTCYDIRLGLMTRDEAIRLIRKYDHVKPRDLARWLNYAGMNEAEFDRIADTFRNPRVWSKKDGQWLKENIWDPPHATANYDGLAA